MKGKQAAIIVSSILAVIGATLPASATVSNMIAQQMSNQQETPLLAAKANKVNPPKGGHTTNQSPSNREKHEQGEARRKKDQENRDWQEYKKKKGRLAKDAWEKAGRPKRD